MARTRNGTALRTPQAVTRRLISAPIAARLLGFDARTIRAWVRRGELDGEIILGNYYVDRSALLRLLRKENMPNLKDRMDELERRFAAAIGDVPPPGEWVDHTPSVGRVVYYTMQDEETGAAHGPLVAFIINPGIGEFDRAIVAALHDDGMWRMHEADREDKPVPGTWMWPPRT